MGLPRWFEGKAERRKQNARSRAQERSHAKASGGKAQPGSGSSWRAPGDVVLPELLDELKYTDKQMFPLSLSDWNGIRKKARLMGREPRMIIDYMKEGYPRLRLAVVEIPLDE